MSEQFERYVAAVPANTAEGWSLTRLMPASRLHGANGIRAGADGRIYVAQVAGSQISAVNIDTGGVESISPIDGGIISPDDLVFDAEGNLYATEITEGRVSVRRPNGETRVLNGDMPCANPITMYQGRLFAGECRPDGRLMELDLNSGQSRVILKNIPMPNAMEVGPDGMLYFPVMGANEIWRINPAGGEPEVVARDLGVPDAVKFDAQGFIVSTQVASGQVLRINPQTGEKTVLATIAPGLDNLTFVGDRLFVSSISGQINEICADGSVKSLIPDGLQWPMGLAIADGELFIADGGYTYTMRHGEKKQVAGMLFSQGFPGFTRGVCAAGAGEWIVSTANGDVARFWPAKMESQVFARGYDRLMDVALTAGGAVIVAELGTGRLLLIDGENVSVLAKDLAKPVGVAIAADGSCVVSESGAGRISRVAGDKVDTLLDGLVQPEGIHISGDLLYIIDVGSKELIEFNLQSGKRNTLVSKLPVGAPPGVVAKPLGGVGVLSGPMRAFTGLTGDADGTLYIAASSEGSVLALSRTGL